MLRLFNPLRMTNLNQIRVSPRRFVWQDVVIARPPTRQQDVIDHSVLKMTRGGSSFIKVIDERELVSAGSKISGGRSKGHKLMRQLPDGSHEFYYFKLPFYRWGFVKELIIGALAQELLGSLAPNVFAVEMAADSHSGLSRYGLVSQSLGSNLHYDNLESWATLYKEDYEEVMFGPKYLGTCLAFKYLLGDSDVKAANVVMLRDQQGHCYPIDHEYACDRPPIFITNATNAVKKLKDFRSIEDDHFIPLQKEPELLEKILPIFSAAVQRDMDTGDILKLYRHFANLSYKRLQGLFNQYGPLVHKEERECLMKDLLARQQEALNFMLDHDSNMIPANDLNQRMKL